MKIRWSDIPFSPARLPFFYGWILLGAATIGIVASIPGQTMGVGIFTDFLIETLGLTRSQLSLAYALGTISSGLLLPLAGRSVDRFGIRPMGVFASVGLGLSLVFMANLTGIVGALPFNGIIAPMAGVYLCFLLLRFFGQGTLTMVSRVAIGKWFNHYRGRAAAIMGIFAAFSFNSSPHFLNYLLGTFGGPGAALVLAAIVGFGMTAIALIFYRDSPEESGLHMDGIEEAEPAEGEAPRAEVRQFDRAEARRTLAFWAFTCGPATQGLIMTAITFHMASIGGESGLDRDTAYALFFPMAFLGVTSNTLGGWLSDKINLRWILGFMMAMQALGIVGLTALTTAAGQWAFIIGHGLSGGLFATMTTVPFPRFFGRKHLGAISGFSLSILVYASAAGPYLFSKGMDFFGSYKAVTWACLLMPVAVCALAAVARDPQEIPSAKDTTSGDSQ